MVDVPKWTRLFIHKVAESEGLEVDGKSLDKFEKYCNEEITDDDLSVQRIYSDKDIVIIKKKKPNKSGTKIGICGKPCHQRDNCSGNN